MWICKNSQDNYLNNSKTLVAGGSKMKTYNSWTQLVGRCKVHAYKELQTCKIGQDHYLNNNKTQISRGCNVHAQKRITLTCKIRQDNNLNHSEIQALLNLALNCLILHVYVPHLYMRGHSFSRLLGFYYYINN